MGHGPVSRRPFGFSRQAAVSSAAWAVVGVVLLLVIALQGKPANGQLDGEGRSDGQPYEWSSNSDQYAEAQARANGAIVYLCITGARPFFGEITASVELLDVAFNARTKYPIIVFHSPKLTDIARKQALLESLTVAPVSFVAIDPSEDVPAFFGSGHHLAANGAACLNQTWPAATLYSNRFFTLSLFRHQALAPYDYAMRIDSDVYFTGHLAVDPISLLANERPSAVFGHSGFFLEQGTGCMAGLRDVVEGHALGAGLTPVSLHLIPEAANYQSRISVARLAYFRSDAYLAAAVAVNEAGGIFSHRWSDQAIYPLIIALHHEIGAVVHLSRLPYKHRQVPRWFREYTTQLPAAGAVPSGALRDFYARVVVPALGIPPASIVRPGIPSLALRGAGPPPPDPRDGNPDGTGVDPIVVTNLVDVEYAASLVASFAASPCQSRNLGDHDALALEALDYKERGQFDQARACYERALAVNPRNLLANRELGDLAVHERDFRAAVVFFTRFVADAPANELPTAMNQLGLAHYRLNHFERAAQAFELAAAAGVTSACYNLARAHYKGGNLASAVTAMEASLDREETEHFMFKFMGVLYYEVGRHEDALKALKIATNMNRDYAEAYNTMGRVYEALGRPSRALLRYKRALKLNDRLRSLHSNIGQLYVKMGETALAEEHFTKLLFLDPMFALGYINMGKLLIDTGRHGEAQRLLESGLDKLLQGYGVDLVASDLRLPPFFLETLASMSHATDVSYLRRIFSLLGTAHNRAGSKALARQYFEIAKEGHTEAYWEWLFLSAELCMFDVVNAEMGRLRRILAEATEPHADAHQLLDGLRPMHAMHYPLDDGELLTVATAWFAAANKTLLDDQGETRPPDWSHLSDDGPLVVAWIGGDFGRHPGGQAVAALFGHFDPKRAVHACFATNADDGSRFYRKAAQECGTWTDASRMTHLEVAAAIRAAGAHVLIDLAGLTSSNAIEVIAARPAPVIASYLGYAGTTANPGLQYILTDRFATPPSAQAAFTERFVYLPTTFFVSSHAAMHANVDQVAASLPPDAGPATSDGDGGMWDGFLYCDFNRLVKIDASAFAAWMRILQEVEGSRLWLLRLPGEAQAQLTRAAIRAGVSPRRILLEDPYEFDLHLAVKQRCDVYLDTTAYNGHATVVDMLWAGVPVVTFPQPAKMVSRVGASLALAAGCKACVVDSWEAYVATAVDLAINSERRRAIRADLVAARSTAALWDLDLAARSLEDAFDAMWQDYQTGSAHQIDVETWRTTEKAKMVT